MKSPYLIQRGKPNPYPRTNEGKISDLIRMDYMGSSEFEFGALPKSLRGMAQLSLQDAKALQPRELPIKDRTGRPMLAFGLQESDIDEYVGFITHITNCEQNRQYHGLKERAEFEDLVTPLDKLPSYHALSRDPPAGHRRGEKKQRYLEDVQKDLTRFWWDLNNNVMMTFEPDIAEKIPGALLASWKSMDPPPAHSDITNLEQPSYPSP